MWMKNVNNFQIAKVQSQGVALHLLKFQQISAWRCLQKMHVMKPKFTNSADFFKENKEAT